MIKRQFIAIRTQQTVFVRFVYKFVAHGEHFQIDFFYVLYSAANVHFIFFGL